VPAIVIFAVSVILISCTRPPCPYRLRNIKELEQVVNMALRVVCKFSPSSKCFDLLC